MSVLLAGLFGSQRRFQGSVPGKVPYRCPMQQRVTVHASSDATGQSENVALITLLQDSQRTLDKLVTALAELRQTKDAELAGLRQEEKKLLSRVNNAVSQNMVTLLRFNAGVIDARGALEDIYQNLPPTGKNRWVAEVGTNAELRECVQKELGVEVSDEDAGRYIYANLYSASSGWVHRSLTRAQLVDSDGTIVLPELPPADESLLRCILISYNFAIWQ